MTERLSALAANRPRRVLMAAAGVFVAAAAGLPVLCALKSQSSGRLGAAHA